MAGPKLEWMYRNSSEVVDSEEYLLGRPVDKAFEASTNKNEIEKDCLPSSLFENTSSRTQVDVIRKLKEDPLEVIKQKEIERRKQLLKNPVKLKKLQNMLRDKQHGTDDTDENKHRKKSKSKSNSEDIDDQVAFKCHSLMKKLGIKSLSDLSDVKIKKNKLKKEHTSKSREESSSSSSESETDEDKHKKGKKKKIDSSDSSSSEEDYKKKSRHNSKYDDDYNKFHKKRKHRSRSSSPRRKISNYRSDKNSPQRNRNTDSKYYKDHSRHPSNVKQKSQPSYQNKRSNNGLSEEEKQKRLQEMMENVQWRDKVRIENVTRYKKEEAAENDQHSKEYNGEFLRKQMSIAAASGTVESRIKSNINSIQRSKFSMNENFARR